jgi:hypothetical protein
MSVWIITQSELEISYGKKQAHKELALRFEDASFLARFPEDEKRHMKFQFLLL